MEIDDDNPIVKYLINSNTQKIILEAEQNVKSKLYEYGRIILLYALKNYGTRQQREKIDYKTLCEIKTGFWLLSICNIQLKHWMKAVESLNIALECGQNADMVYYNLGFVHFKLQNLSHSVIYYKMIKNDLAQKSKKYCNYIERIQNSINAPNVSTTGIPPAIFYTNDLYQLPQPKTPETNEFNSNSCRICRQPFNDDTIAVRIECCSAIYHKYCIKSWFQLCSQNPNCPMCHKTQTFNNDNDNNDNDNNNNDNEIQMTPMTSSSSDDDDDNDNEVYAPNKSALRLSVTSKSKKSFPIIRIRNFNATPMTPTSSDDDDDNSISMGSNNNNNSSTHSISMRSNDNKKINDNNSISMRSNHNKKINDNNSISMRSNHNKKINDNNSISMRSNDNKKNDNSSSTFNGNKINNTLNCAKVQSYFPPTTKYYHHNASINSFPTKKRRFHLLSFTPCPFRSGNCPDGAKCPFKHK